MKIVFLDFDGVLNAETDEVDAADELWTAAWLDTAMVGRLASLVEQSGAHVVVSSSWRQRRTRDELESILREHGYSHGVHDVTERLPRRSTGEEGVREAEIKEWLARHPEAKSFVVLDDETDLGDLAPHHVRTDPAVGLTFDDIERAAKILAVHRDR